MKINSPILTTDRLLLRPSLVEDAPFVLRLFSAPKWLKFIGDRNVRTVAEAEAYIEAKMLPQFPTFGFGNFTVIRKDTEEKIGFCGLNKREKLTDVDLGFAFLPEFEKQGFAYEAASRIRDAAFSDYGLKRLAAITTKENLDSQKLLVKLGFDFVDTIELVENEELRRFYIYNPLV